jgi:hypothetical protein
VNVPRREIPRPTTIVHQAADRSVTLRRLSARRRLARIDPETVQRKALRVIDGGADG